MSAPAFAQSGEATRNWASPNAASPQAEQAAPRAPLKDNFADNMALISALASPGGTPAPAATTTRAGPSTPFDLGAEKAPAAALPAAPAAPNAQPFDLAGTGAAAPSTAQTADAAPSEPIDLSALRYYASQNNIARVAAEIRRIKSLHPSWEVPQQLFTETVVVDEQPMWDLYGEGRLDAIYDMIRRQKTKTPSYVPSEDLVEKLKVAEARRAIGAYAENAHWVQAVRAAQAVPNILVCGEMQTLWNVAEALARTAAEDRALDLYSYIMDECTNPAERVATLQKASVVLNAEPLDRLLVMSEARVEDPSAIDKLRMDRLRGKVGNAIGERFGQQPTSDELEQLGRSAMASRSAEDATLLGWYYYKKNSFDDARAWFDRSLQMTFSTKALEGYILSLREGGKAEEAREVALEYNSTDPAIGKLFIEIASAEMTDDDPAPVSASNLDLIQTVVEKHQSALGAQSLGWYLYNQEEYKNSLKWFEKSMDWEVTAEGALGLAIARNKTGDRKGVKELAQKHGDEYPTLVAFLDKIGPEPRRRPSAQVRRASASKGSTVRRKASQQRRTARRGNRNRGGGRLVREAVRAYKSGDYKTALNKLDANKAVNGKSRDLALLRGWALHKNKQYKKAYKHFNKINKAAPSKKAREGALHSYRRFMPPRWH